MSDKFLDVLLITSMAVAAAVSVLYLYSSREPLWLFPSLAGITALWVCLLSAVLSS